MPVPWHYDNATVRIRKLCVGPYENNVYVVACPTTGDAVIVDAAAEPERIVAAVADVTPRAILTTHGHADHVGAVDEVRRRLGIPMRLHPADATISGVRADEPLEAGAIAVGDLAIRSIPTPGHTPGSTCLLVGSVLLSGDTLFPGGPGATRFPYSSFERIIAGIEGSLLTLPDETIVMPGHGLDTTIGAERPHLAAWKARGW